MKIALALLALSGLAANNAQRIPLVDEVIREVSDEIIYDDAPMRRTLKHVDESIQSPLVEEVIRRGSEEIIYGNVAEEADISSKGTVNQNANGMHHRGLAPEDALFAGHEQASHSGVPKNETKQNTHFKDASHQQREHRHLRLLDLSMSRNPAEEVRVLVGYVDVAGKTLIDSKASVVYEYIDEIRVVSCLITWENVKLLLSDANIE
jgi:hypothetical protein